MLRLEKEWEENNLQLFLYSDAAGGQVPPQKYSHYIFVEIGGGPFDLTGFFL